MVNQGLKLQPLLTHTTCNITQQHLLETSKHG